MYNYVVKIYNLENDTMELTQIKTGIFGYSKKSVCQYITEQNEIHSAALAGEKEASDKKIEELNAKIAFLTSENQELNTKLTELGEEMVTLKENYALLTTEKETVENEYRGLLDETQELREKSDVISTAIINAEKCATAMINDANVRAKDMIDEAQDKVQDEVKRLETAKGYISDVRIAVEAALKKIDAELSDIEADIYEKKNDVTSEKRASIKEKFGLLEKNIFKKA